MTAFRERKWTFVTAATYGLFAGLNAWTALRADDRSTEPAAALVTNHAASSQIDRSRFTGARTCLDCHRSEYVSWLKTAHYKNRVNRFEDTESSISSKYRKLMGNVDRCYHCHSLPADERFGRRFVESGTSCESCHGAAGGEQGWLNRHAVYGPNVTRLDQEAPDHFADRITYCENAGMTRPGRQYSTARNCLSCHIAGDLMLFEAGHKVSFDNFSLIPYLLGEVRHNFHMNQRHNAKSPTLDTKRRGLSPVHRVRLYFIVEQLARMEVALNYLANLPNEQSMEEGLADELIGIFDDAAGELEEFAEVLMEELDPAGESLSEEDVEPLLAAVQEFEQFQDLESPTRADALASAQHISALANEFLKSHDGSRLGALDIEFLEDLGDPVGEALEP